MSEKSKAIVYEDEEVVVLEEYDPAQHIFDGEINLRTYGSQGQQRTAALSIKLAELDLFADLTGETPILLLDDVFSELDSSRQARLLTAVANHQVVITATDAPSVGKIFHIKNGQIVSQ